MSMADQSAPQGSFRLSMLLYDTRYRSLTIQVVFLILFMAGAAWLIDNTVNNLRELGKDPVFDYGFLNDRAGYVISQMLVEYSPESTHARALLIGLLNTLLVSFLGCITATFIGVTAGVLRLSSNWVVARLMTVYIETFRNIPVLLWILLIYAIISESLPEPKEFRGDDATASMIFNDSVAITNRAFYVPEPLFSRTLGNIDVGIFLISVDLLVVLAALILSIFVVRKISANAINVQNETGVLPTTWWKKLLVIFVPVILVLFALGLHWGYPAMERFNFDGGISIIAPLIALWLALSVYTGAFIAENVRAGIQAISKGQSEAAAALGVRPSQSMRLVILPQAMRVIVPPLISQYLNLTKNSSLAIAVGYMDLRATLGGITLSVTGRELEAMILMMAIYLTISLMISSGMNYYNTRSQLRER